MHTLNSNGGTAYFLLYYYKLELRIHIWLTSHARKRFIADWLSLLLLLWFLFGRHRQDYKWMDLRWKPIKSLKFSNKKQQLANCCNTSFFVSHTHTCRNVYIAKSHSMNSHIKCIQLAESFVLLFSIYRTEIVHVNSRYTIKPNEEYNYRQAGMCLYLFLVHLLCRFAFHCSRRWMV